MAVVVNLQVDFLCVLTSDRIHFFIALILYHLFVVDEK